MGWLWWVSLGAVMVATLWLFSDLIWLRWLVGYLAAMFLAATFVGRFIAEGMGDDWGGHEPEHTESVRHESRRAG